MKTVYLFLLLLGAVQTTLHGESGFTGQVVDKFGIAVPNATIYIESVNRGQISNSDGYFLITLKAGEYQVQVSAIGFATQILPVTVTDQVSDLGKIVLQHSNEVIDEIVISSSRIQEKITKAPATVDIITASQFENITGSPEELFALQKGVDFSRIGNFWGSISIRGFNSAFNQKMLILDDNRIAHVRIRTPVGPLSPFIKEDIEKVEIVLGPSSALYGPNSLNGVFYTVSKSPFKYKGTEAVIGAGSNIYYNLRLRHANAIKDKWAYKVTTEYLRGAEEKWTDSVYLASSTPGEFVGKAEVGVDRDVSFFKTLLGLYFKPRPNTEFGLNYALNLSNSISVGNAGRNNLKDWNNSSLQVTYKSPHWYGQFYRTWIKLDRSVNLLTRTTNYYTLINQSQSPEEALQNSLAGPQKASIEEDSYRNNAEVQGNYSWKNFDVVAGAQYQKEHAFSNNTYLLDGDGAIELEQFGLYGQISYKPEKTGLEFLLTARGDEHSLYGFNFLPKAGVLYTSKPGTLRLTYGEGYSTPTLINTHMSLGGGVVLGNSDGFTLSDGSKIDPIRPEKIKTLEVGYKTILLDRKLFLDTDAYYNWSKNMISPVFNIVPMGTSGGPVVTHRGNRPISDFTHGVAPGRLPAGAVINTNVNFGEVETYGFDIGLNYYFSNYYNLTLNYSYFDYRLDKNDMQNDGNQDGKVTDNDLSVNTPKHKISSAINVKYRKFYGTLFTRWVQKYDFFSGRNVSAATSPETIFNGTSVIEGQRVGTQWNYGQLGGFFLSMNGNYQLTKRFNLGAYINNLLGRGNYEFITTAPTETTFGAELKVTITKD
ncbi:TonB-dependent receptor [Pontibacter anaerobius]|uniref:TonB-dependent receptor n=1 Tax=Pontibacter anaerobius TaxID=2993940 RepID=A0ABT3RJZ6_9BACT|nr:TonB-dependent receptor [Pontibacter anaerobius]MCX2742172.1 TonB-dependent receptor [Pontibacter anaerobius]